jgi:hypothetical protein
VIICLHNIIARAIQEPGEVDGEEEEIIVM